MELTERILKRVEKQDSGCWIFQGTPSGPYGRISIDGVLYGVHRVFYEAIKGEISDGFVIDHLCRNTRCVNPDHLEVVTNAVNTFRGITAPARNRMKRKCDKGHELAGENLAEYVRPDGRKYRVCRQCRIDHGKRRRSTLQAV